MYDTNPWRGRNSNGWGYDPGPQTPPPSQNAGQRLARFNSAPNQPPSALPGRIIQSPGDVMPDEVPMDGSLSVFPLADLSCIYAKGWTDNGITTVRYVPEQRVVEQAQRPAVIPEDFRNEIFARLDAIEAALPKPKQATKKEEKTNG